LTHTYKKPEIMILGIFHMRDTPDLYKARRDDIHTEEGQREIRKVVDCIKEFKPTKIAFEIVKEKQGTLHEEYRQFLNGMLEPEVNEIHQLGFRAAAELSHDTVYAVDWMDDVENIGLGDVFEWAKKHQPDMVEMINGHYRPKIKQAIEDSSIIERIKALNTESNIELNHEMYMAIARIGQCPEYVGIDWLRWWYQRNLIIYANLAEITCPTDRTLLIIGSAHIHLITQFLKESGLFNVVPANGYLA